MAFDKSKVLRSAEKFVASGKTLQAIEEYEKVLNENPKEWNVMIQLGDLYLKANKSAEAIQNFRRVADHYYTDGFFLKAIAIYKRINKFDPNLTDICIKLAELYLKQGLTMDAKSQLQVVAQHYLSKNQNKEAIQTLKKLIEIEPENLRTRNELAKTYKNEGLVPEAVREYLEISDLLTRKNLLKESLAVLETAYKMDPKDTDILQKILTLYYEHKEPAKAAALLDEAIRLDPSNPEKLALLAESYADRKQIEKAQETIDRAILSSTRKEPVWRSKGNICLKAGDLQGAFTQYSQVVEKLVQRKDFEEAVSLMQKITRADASFPQAWQKLIDLYSMLRQQSNILLAHGALVDAFISKTMYPEAAKVLEKLITLEPDDNQHREKLEFVRSFLEKTKPVFKPPVPPEKVYEVETRGSEEISREDVDLNLRMEPEPVRKPATSPQPQIQKRVAPQSAMAQTLLVATVSADDEKEFVSEHLIEADVFNKYGLIDKAVEQLQIIIAKYPTSVGTRQKLKEIYLEKGERDKAVDECVVMSRILRKKGDLDQAEDLLSEARQINPNHPALDKAYKELPAAAKQTDVLGEIEKLAQSIKTKSGSFKIQRPVQKPAAAPAPVPPPPPVVAAKQEEEIEIEVEEFELRTEQRTSAEAGALPEDAFEEVDFYAAQGLVSEARNLLLSLKEKNSSDPGVLSRLKELEEGVAKPEEKLLIVPEEEEISVTVSEEEMDLPSLEIPPLQEARAVPTEEPESPAEEEIVIQVEEEVPSFEMPSGEPVEEPEMPLEAGSVEVRFLDLGESAESEAKEMEAEMETPIEVEIEEPVEARPESFSEDLGLTEFAELEDEGVEAQPQAPAELAGGVGRKKLEHESFNDAVDAAFERAEKEPKQEEPKEEEIETAPVKASEELFEEEDDFFDLAAELEEGFLNVQSAVEEKKPADGQNYSIEEILVDFKKGVEKQLSAEDYDTRYNLGIAYKEMGLIDEAIAEFQMASKDPKRFLECSSMLGLCFLEKGMPKLAIKWYQRGLETEGHTEEEYRGLSFELGQALEASGELDQALETFQEVYGMNASYRNVARKIKEIQDQLKRK